MHVVGVVEIIAGVLVLSRWTRLGSYLVALWLVGIVGNLLSAGMFYDLAMRDLEIAAAAFTLAQLTAVREGVDGRIEARRKALGSDPLVSR
jgi:hypothetical protein